MIKISRDSTRGAFWDARHLSKLVLKKSLDRAIFGLNDFWLKCLTVLDQTGFSDRYLLGLGNFTPLVYPIAPKKRQFKGLFKCQRIIILPIYVKSTKIFPKRRVERWSAHLIWRFKKFRHSIFASIAEYQLNLFPI